MSGFVLYDQHIKHKQQIIAGLDGVPSSSVTFSTQFIQVTNSLTQGCALCSAVFNEETKLFIDYELLESNTFFEKILGIAKNNFIGKKVSEIKTDISTAKFDFLNVMGHVAKYNSSTLFYFCTEDDKKWYSASAFSPEKGYFILILEEITLAKVEDIKKRKAAFPDEEVKTANE
jgi:hypothetical protein